MTWKSITREELEFAKHMVTWIEIARKWRYGPDWLPTEADICKSALLERLRNGLEPLGEPPPLGLSCPWYALVEDPSPQNVGDFVHFIEKNDRMQFPGEAVLVLQNPYRIIEEFRPLPNLGRHLLIRDARYESGYRFHLWHDKDWTHPSLEGWRRQNGTWFIQNAAFYGGVFALGAINEKK